MYTLSGFFHYSLHAKYLEWFWPYHKCHSLRDWAPMPLNPVFSAAGSVNNHLMGHNHTHWRRQWQPHASVLAWRIPGMGEPGGLQSMGSLRVGLDWVTSLSLFTFMHWRRKWHPTPVFLPGESQGWGSLVGCRLWGCTESDTTEAT